MTEERIAQLKEERRVIIKYLAQHNCGCPEVKAKEKRLLYIDSLLNDCCKK